MNPVGFAKPRKRGRPRIYFPIDGYVRSKGHVRTKAAPYSDARRRKFVGSGPRRWIY